MLVFFDLDGTLLDHASAEKAACEKFEQIHASRLRVPEFGFARHWNALAEKYMDLYLQGELSLQEQRRLRIGEVFGEAMPSEKADELFGTYLNFYEDSWRLFDDVLPALHQLSHLQLGMITNGSREQQNKKLAATQIAGKFKLVLTSEEAKFSKPNAEIFRLGAQRMNVDPKECVYVGDRLDIDAQAAMKAGWKGIWLNRGPRIQCSVPSIQTLSELGSVLEL